MKLPATFALLVALALPAGGPVLAASVPSVERSATDREIVQFHEGRQGRAFWLGSDKAADALLTLLE